MSEDKKDVVNDWIKFKLMEAVKKDPLYKDPKEDKAVMKDEETNLEIERAIDEIIKYDFMNIYKKVRRPDKT